MTQDLWEIYQTTCFVLPDKISLNKPEFCRNFAIISAINPEGEQQSLQLNQQAEQTMKDWLNRYGYHYHRIYGCSPDLDYVEPSFLINMPDKACAIELAALFNQNASFGSLRSHNLIRYPSSVLPQQLHRSLELSYGALKTNNNPAPVDEVISCTLLTNWLWPDFNEP